MLPSTSEQTTTTAVNCMPTLIDVSCQNHLHIYKSATRVAGCLVVHFTTIIILAVAARKLKRGSKPETERQRARE
jgi:hypothetical protein